MSDEPKLKVTLGLCPSDCTIRYGDIDLTAALRICRMEVAPVDADHQKVTEVILTIMPDSVEINADNPQLVIDGQTFNLIPA